MRFRLPPPFLPIALAATLLAAPATPVAGPDEFATDGDTSSERVLRTGHTSLWVRVIDVDDPARAGQLQQWASEAADAMLTAYGRFPLRDAQVRIQQVERADESPVPWGQTLRRDDVAVLLYVRRDATLDELRADWTAVHELAHLFHPYLGSDGRWLAEGLASYYQNVLRARAGILDERDAWERLDAGFGRGRREDSGATLEDLSRRHRGTMRVYWAGAAYWLEVDLALRARGNSLDRVLDAYARCCLGDGGEVEPAAFVTALDRIAGGDDFSRRWRTYAQARTFPPLRDSYAALGLSEDDNGGLRLSREPAAAKLRQAIMGRRPAPASPSAQ